MNQAVALTGDQLWTGAKADKVSDTAESMLKHAHDTLALELGLQWLSDRWWFHTSEFNGTKNTQTYTYTYADMCKNFLIKMPTDLADADDFIKDRISLFEIAFKMKLGHVEYANSQLESQMARA